MASAIRSVGAKIVHTRPRSSGATTLQRTSCHKVIKTNSSAPHSTLNSERAKKAEWEIPHLKRRHAAKLKAALEDEDGFVEIGFKKLWVTKVSAKASLAVKRRSATFRELAKMGLKSDSLGLRKFEYEGRKITPVDYDKTLSEVSGVLLETGHCRQLTNAWVLAWV